MAAKYTTEAGVIEPRSDAKRREASSKKAYNHLEESTETSPLLSNAAEIGYVSEIQSENHPRRRSEQFLLTILFTCLLLISFGDALLEFSNVKIFESIICYRYWEDAGPDRIKIGRDRIGPGAIDGVDEVWCKVHPVASDLATLLGNQQFFDGIPSLLLSIPFGWLADKYGRKPFFVLGCLGFPLRAAWMQLVMWNWQAFDTRWSWISAAFNLPGGGSMFTTTILFVICSDVVSPDNRAAMFFRLGAVNVSALLLMPPLAGLLMEISPWIPSLGASACMILAAGFSLLLPETLNYSQHSMGITAVLPSLPVPANVPDTHQDSDPDPGCIARLRKSLHFLIRDWRVPALILTFAFYGPNGSLSQLLLQYVAQRYSISLSKATLLITIREAVHVGLFLIILPYTATVLLRVYGNCGQTKDLYLARASQFLISIGWILTAISPNIVTVVASFSIATLGMGATLIVRSYLTSLLPSHDAAKVYALVGIASQSGIMVGAPLLAWLLERGMDLGGGWIGLPFLTLGVGSGMVMILLFHIQIPGEEEITREASATHADDEDVRLYHT